MKASLPSTTKWVSAPISEVVLIFPGRCPFESCYVNTLARSGAVFHRPSTILSFITWKKRERGEFWKQKTFLFRQIWLPFSHAFMQVKRSWVKFNLSARSQKITPRRDQAGEDWRWQPLILIFGNAFTKKGSDYWPLIFDKWKTTICKIWSRGVELSCGWRARLGSKICFVISGPKTRWSVLITWQAWVAFRETPEPEIQSAFDNTSWFYMVLRFPYLINYAQIFKIFAELAENSQI